MNRRDWSAVLAGTLASCGSREKAPVRIAMARAGIHYLPIYIARSLEFFRGAGVIEFFETAGSSKAMEALIGGSADVILGGHSQVL